MASKKRYRMWEIILIVLFLSSVTWGASSTTSEVAPTNMVVDFDLTGVDSNLRRGAEGTLNLVIKNTGGQIAEKVDVWIPGTNTIIVNKRFYIGRMDPGESKTIPVMIRVDDEARTGLNSVQVRINYDGFDSDGDRDSNQISSWEIPIRVYADPSFQIWPEKTTYFKDTIDKLVLTAKSQDDIEDLSVTLSSDCLTVIGSSRKYLREVEANENFTIEYDIKPSEEGACDNILSFSYLDEDGSRASDDVSLGINVEKAGVDFKIVNVSCLSASPGEKVRLDLAMRNVGKATADDVTLVLSLSDPFVPVDTTDIYVGEVMGGETIDASFNIAIGWDAEIKVHSLPLEIEYKVGGTSYSVEKDIGLDVSGNVLLEIINVETSGSSTRVEVVNLGTRDAEGVKATLVVGSGAQMTTASADTSGSTRGGEMMIPGMRTMQRATETRETETQIETQSDRNQSGESQYLVDYKSDIKANKDTTFTFDGIVSGTATLILEYTDTNNKRVEQVEKITVGSARISTTGTSSRIVRGSGTGIGTYLLYGVIIVMIVFVIYRKYKGEPIVPEFLAKRIGK